MYTPNKLMSLFQNYLPEDEFFINWCRGDVDFVYATSGSVVKQAVKAGREYDKPVVCWVWDLPSNWDDWSRTEMEKNANRWRTDYIKEVVKDLKQCKLIFSPSTFTQQTLSSFGVDSILLEFYIDTEELDQHKSHGFKYNIIQISRFAINKRFDITIQAMSKLKTSGQRIDCIGMGGDYSKEFDTAKRLGVDAEFYKKMSRPELITRLKSSKILVSPSVFEGWGITPIEALYCGVPVLLSDLDVFKETYGDTVIYHKKDDPDDMAEKLDLLINDYDLRKRIVKDSKTIIREFTAEKFAARWKQVITNFI